MQCVAFCDVDGSYRVGFIWSCGELRGPRTLHRNAAQRASLLGLGQRMSWPHPPAVKRGWPWVANPILVLRSSQSGDGGINQDPQEASAQEGKQMDTLQNGSQPASPSKV